MRVLEGDNSPPFCYSVGIQKSCDAPELIVVGLNADLAQSMINEYNARVRKDGPLEVGKYYSDFLEGFECLLQTVDKTHYTKYFGWDTWLYGGPDYNAVQLIYPTKSGHWPWQLEATDMKEWQPVLTTDGRPVIA